MASTFSTNLRLEKPGYNESADTWGTIEGTCKDRVDACLGGAIYGLTLSTAGSSATFGIAAGGASGMNLASAYTKTTSAWALGTAAGSLDTGAIANSTWYHVYVIERIDVSPTVTDVLISTSATAPTMPTNYTRKRRIGSMLTNGSAQWTPFSQIGNYFYWTAEVVDVLNSTCIAAATSYALTTPPGVSTFPILSLRLDFTGAMTNFCIGPGGSSGSLSVASGSGGTVWIPITTLATDTSKQIVVNANSTNGTISIFNIGYQDLRGQV